MIRSLLFTLCLIPINSQYIDMTICSDTDCKTNCISWTTISGQCYSNSITTLNSFATYSDTNCNTLVSNTYKTPIIADNNCNQLYIYGNSSQPISYRAINISLLIAIGFGILFIFCICCICIFIRCRKRKYNQRYPPVVPTPIYGYQYNLPPQTQYMPPPTYIMQPPPVYIIPPPPLAPPPSAPPHEYSPKII